MVSSSDDIFALYPQRYTIGVGATLAQWIDILPAEKSLTVKYLSGGTLEILPALSGASLIAAAVAGASQGVGFYQPTAGTTQTPAMLAALSGTGYLMGTSEVLTVDGAPRIYLSATGITTFVTVIRACGAGA